MSSIKVHSLTQASPVQIAGGARSVPAWWLLLSVWLCMGMVPLLLQTRSYIKFVMPHKVTDILLVPQDAPKQTANLPELCPVRAHLLAQVWWNLEATHYFMTEHGRVCHYVTPQYNVHGNYFIGKNKTAPFHTTPSSCAHDSYPYVENFYHGSIGYYSFYIETVGTFCAKDNNSYIVGKGLGSYDINGQLLAEYRGDGGYKRSYWYGTFGACWLVYRAFVLRRSFISCRRYGRRCEQMGEALRRRQAVVFVQESLRLSAHGATNYHRAALLVLIVEGIMSDLFLIIANNGLATLMQYTSLGYNLSGLMLLLFEIVENTKKLSEQWRLFIKRLLFSYESTLVGELVTAAVLQYFLTALNRTDLERSRTVALAVSYYFWGLICHGIVVLAVVGNIIVVRVFLATTVVWWKHRSLAVFTAPCCVDSTFGVRNRMTMLTGYRLDNGNLYYSTRALKAFGLLRMEEEDGSEFLVLHKLYWLTVPRDNLFVIGAISGHRVESCTERPCSGVVSYIDRSLGGKSINVESPRPFFSRRRTRVSAGPESLAVNQLAPSK